MGGGGPLATVASKAQKEGKRQLGKKSPRQKKESFSSSEHGKEWNSAALRRERGKSEALSVKVALPGERGKNMNLSQHQGKGYRVGK